MVLTFVSAADNLITRGVDLPYHRILRKPTRVHVGSKTLILRRESDRALLEAEGVTINEKGELVNTGNKVWDYKVERRKAARTKRPPATPHPFRFELPRKEEVQEVFEEDPEELEGQEAEREEPEKAAEVQKRVVADPEVVTAVKAQLAIAPVGSEEGKASDPGLGSTRVALSERTNDSSSRKVPVKRLEDRERTFLDEIHKNLMESGFYKAIYDANAKYATGFKKEDAADYLVDERKACIHNKALKQIEQGYPGVPIRVGPGVLYPAVFVNVDEDSAAVTKAQTGKSNLPHQDAHKQAREPGFSDRSLLEHHLSRYFAERDAKNYRALLSHQQGSVFGENTKTPQRTSPKTAGMPKTPLRTGQN